jgi:DNA-binding beta-propeller fold protein YncE
LNWIVDKWGYQLLKTTYDVEHTILTYETNWPPTDMALSKDIGTAVILYQSSGTVEEIDLSGGFKNRYNQIKYPTAVVFEPVDSKFWIADSSGYLYQLDTQSDEVRVIYSSLSRPVALHCAPTKNLISVVDIGSKEIIHFNRSGQRLNSIRFINGERLEGPSQFIIDEVNDRYWLIDGNENVDYIYARHPIDNAYSLIDSLEDAGDLEIGLIDGTAWIGSIDIPNSLVLQLSPEGTRQLQLSGFYYAYDLQINPYDGTLLVIDLRNTEKDRVMHYNRSHEVIGSSNIYNTPVRVLVE